MKWILTDCRDVGSNVPVDWNVDDLKTVADLFSTWLRPINVSNIHVTALSVDAQFVELLHKCRVVIRKIFLQANERALLIKVKLEC